MRDAACPLSTRWGGGGERRCARKAPERLELARAPRGAARGGCRRGPEPARGRGRLPAAAPAPPAPPPSCRARGEGVMKQQKHSASEPRRAWSLVGGRGSRVRGEVRTKGSKGMRGSRVRGGGERGRGRGQGRGRGRGRGGVGVHARGEAFEPGDVEAGGRGGRRRARRGGEARS